MVAAKRNEETVEYVAKLSGIFRYILQSEKKGLVQLQEELTFLNAYRYLLEIRYSGKISFLITVKDAELTWQLPVLSLLPLVENVVKHNIIDSEHKMTVYLSVLDSGDLSVTNPVYRKYHVEGSNGIGLSNLSARYKLLMGTDIEVREDESYFTVILPLKKQTMKVLIVEDETIAYEYLTELIGRVDPEIEIVAVTESISQTTKWLNTHPAPDLIFMDIHLSDGSAFSIFDLITVETPVIFTTAYDEYAINAFKVNSIDYLLKPVEEGDLRKAIGKFCRLTSPERVRYLEQQAQTNYSGNYFRKLLVAHRDNLVPVDVEQIVYFYTSDHQTSICLTDGRQFTYNKTLDSIIQNLDPAMFFRANKQFIVSKEHVTHITIWFDRRLLITLRTDTPERIYVSKNRSTEFKEWMMGGNPIKI